MVFKKETATVLLQLMARARYKVFRFDANKLKLSLNMPEIQIHIVYASKIYLVARVASTKMSLFQDNGCTIQSSVVCVSMQFAKFWFISPSVEGKSWKRLPILIFQLSALAIYLLKDTRQ